MKKSYFPSSGNFYKGSLHCHSTVSDGRKTPEELMHLYKDMGFDFLAFTEHSQYRYYEPTAGLTVLDGVEIDVSFLSKDKYMATHHIVGIFPPGEAPEDRTQFELLEWEGIETGRKLINQIKRYNGLVIYAHPMWSLVTIEDIRALGFDMVEIYNSTCDIRYYNGDGESYVNQLLWSGEKFFYVASDDSHQRADNDFGFGWISIKAESKSKEALFNGIKNGSFYASTGPEIYDFGTTEGSFYVECSPCASIAFAAFPTAGKRYHAIDKPLTSACHPINENAKYIRAVVIDELGHKAWTQPIYFK